MSKPDRYERPGLIFRKECLSRMEHHASILFGFEEIRFGAVSHRPQHPDHQPG